MLLVHAKDNDAAHFCQSLGFERSPVDDLVLMLLVKDVRAL